MSKSSFCRWLIWALLLAAPLSSSCLKEASEPKPLAATVCAITTHPKQFQGKLVSFLAQFQSDGIEHSVLVDPWCKHGLAPHWSDSPKGGAEFDKALHIGFQGTLDKTITATWVGRFEWHPKQIPTWVLNVLEIKDLKLDYSPPPRDLPPPDVHLPDPPLPAWPPN